MGLCAFRKAYGVQNLTFSGRLGLKHVPGGPNEVWIRPQVDFDLAPRIIRAREAQEPGNDGFSSKYCLHVKKKKRNNRKTDGDSQ